LKIKDLTERIIDKLSSNFDIKKNQILEGIEYDFLAVFTEETNKYILSKDMVYDSFSSNEKIYNKKFKFF